MITLFIYHNAVNGSFVSSQAQDQKRTEERLYREFLFNCYNQRIYITFTATYRDLSMSQLIITDQRMKTGATPDTSTIEPFSSFSTLKFLDKGILDNLIIKRGDKTWTY